MMYHSAITAPEVARLEDYVRAVQRHKWVVIALTLSGLVGPLLYLSSRTVVYTATATVVLRPTPVDSVDGRLVSPNPQTEREVLASDKIADLVISELGLTAPSDRLLRNLQVEFLPSSDVLHVSYSSISAEGAAVAANAFAQTYVDHRETAAITYYESTISAADAQVAGHLEELGTIHTQIENLRGNRREVLDSLEPGDARDQVVTEIDTQLNTLQGQAAAVNASIREVEGAAASANSDLATRSTAAEVLRTATAPTDGDGADAHLIVVGGVVLGSLLAFITAFLLDRLDTKARDPEDVALALSTSIMGAIPTLGRYTRADGPIMLSTGGSARVAAAREAFRRLRSSIQFLNSSHDVSSIIVTSSSPAEGKSLTSANLAIALAQNGSRCVLVSADLRQPRLEQLFGMESSRPGLSEYLAAEAELNAEKVSGIDNLWLIRAGTPPSDPGELLSSDRFEQMIKELEHENVAYVVVDTPPVLCTADAVSAARHVDGVVVVVDTERTDTSDLLRVRAELECSGSKLVGAVLNRQRFDGGGMFRRTNSTPYRVRVRHWRSVTGRLAGRSV
jgi:capsular exopolysaccharide synthesis family protein